MTDHKENYTLLKVLFLAGVIFALLALTGCQSVDKILAGSTHACGTIHVEGYYSDSQGDIRIVKAPDTWEPDQIQQFCSN